MLTRRLLGRRAVDGRDCRRAMSDSPSTRQAKPLSSMVFATHIARQGSAPARTACRRHDQECKRLVLSTTATHGVPIALVERSQPPGALAADSVDEASAICALDHVVIRTPNPERAVAFYAGRLGLDLRLDRSNPEWGSRLLFFRCGDLVVEIAHDLKAGVSDGPDQLWGLSWRTPDIAKANARLKAAGVDVSPPRTGAPAGQRGLLRQQPHRGRAHDRDRRRRTLVDDALRRPRPSCAGRGLHRPRPSPRHRPP